MLGRRAGVGGNQPDHPLGRGHRRVIAQPPDVALLMHRDGGDAVSAGLVNRHPRGPFGDHETEAPVAVDHGGAGRFLFDDKVRAGDDMPGVDAVGVGGNLDNPVGIVAAQVGLDQMGGHHFGLRLGRPLGAVDVIGRAVQVIGRKDGHNATSCRR